MNILLLEDNLKLNTAIQKRLEMKHYHVDTFNDGQEALDAIEYSYSTQNQYSCFLLDINVPNVDGIKILQKIRELYKKVPVIIISASVELELIKKSYDFGCNDYIKKPFFIDELEIKIDKLCNIQTTKIQYDTDAYFDFESSTIQTNNEEKRLTKKERLLLNLFLSNPNKIITYEQIEHTVWEGAFVSQESIRTLIRRLRKVLEKEYIETLVDRGYKFNLAV